MVDGDPGVDNDFPKPPAKRKPRRASTSARRGVRSTTPELTSAWARSTAAAWVECTTYTGAWWVSMIPAIVSWIGLSDQE